MEAREHGTWTMSRLAEKRAAQRNVDPKLFPVLQKYGRRLYVRGDLHVFLGKNMVPDDEYPQRFLRRIQNTMVVVAPDGTVKTVWKDARALRKLKRKRFRRRGFGRREGLTRTDRFRYAGRRSVHRSSVSAI